MSGQYLLECECGNSLHVESGQAGQLLDCTCGKTVCVPTFRELRRLPRAAPNNETAQRESTWTRRQGGMFVLGIVISTCAILCLGYVLTQRFRLKPFVTPLDRFLDEEDVSTLSNEDALIAWNTYREMGLIWGHSRGYREVHRRATRLNALLAIAAAAAVLGLVITVAPFLRTTKQRHK